MKILKQQYNVLNSMMDPEFRLTPGSLISLTQDIFARYCSAYWCGAFDLREKNRMWIINDFTFRITDAMPFWTESIDVETWFSEKPAIKLRQDYRLSQNGKVFAIGDCTWAVLDMESRKPLAASDVLPEFELHEEIVLGTHRHRFPQKTEPLLTYRHMTNNNDKDFNYHVTNVSYANICLGALPEDYLSSHELHEFSIKFLQETFIGQELQCQVSRTATPNLWTYDITSDGATLACQAYAQYGEPYSREGILDRNLPFRNTDKQI